MSDENAGQAAQEAAQTHQTQTTEQHTSSTEQGDTPSEAQQVTHESSQVTETETVSTEGDPPANPAQERAGEDATGEHVETATDVNTGIAETDEQRAAAGAQMTRDEEAATQKAKDAGIE